MRITIIFTLIINLGVGFCPAQTQFAQAIHDVGGFSFDKGNSVKQTLDGGYVVAGYTGNFGSGWGDFFLVKFNAIGSVEWAHAIGGISYDESYSIIQTNDGGFAMVGETWNLTPDDTTSDLFFVKLNSMGEEEWDRAISGTSGIVGYSIIQTTDNGYAAVGQNNYFGEDDADIFIVKLTLTGVLEWSCNVGGTGSEVGYSIVQTNDSGYAVAGWTESYGVGERDFFLVRLSSSGDMIWSRTVGGVNNDNAGSLVYTSDGGFVVTGYTSSYGIGGDLLLVKFSATGSMEWSRAVGGTNGDCGYSVVQTSDDGFATVGVTSSFGAGIPDTSNIFLVKLNSAGTFEWSRAVSLGGMQSSYGSSVVQTIDGGYAVTGTAESVDRYLFLVKLDSNGNGCIGEAISPTVTFTSPTVTIPVPLIENTIPTISSVSTTITIPTPTVTEICESSACLDTLFLFFPGWNLIGGPVGGISTSVFASYPAIILPAYGYEEPGGYYISDFLEYKKGYWILALDTVVVCEDSTRFHK